MARQRHDPFKDLVGFLVGWEFDSLRLTRRIAVRSLVLTATSLHDGGGQFELWPSEELCAAPKAVALQRALDRMKRVTSDQ